VPRTTDNRASAAATAAPRAIEPEDLYGIRVPTEPRISPDGRTVAFTVQTVAPRRDGYRHSLWLAPFDASAPARQVTIGAKNDRAARWSPDGRTLAFLSDRRPLVEEEPDAPDPKEREDSVQIHLLPLDGGEARRLTNLPRGVDGFEWSPDGSHLLALTSSAGATRDEDARRRRRGPQKPTDPPESDYRYLDRLRYMVNAAGFTYDKIAQIWLVDAASGEARRLTRGRSPIQAPIWSPDGRRIAYAVENRGDRDLVFMSEIHVVDVETGRDVRVTSTNGYFDKPAWLPDSDTLAVLGHRWPAAGGSRNDIWLFAADGSEAGPRDGRNLTGVHDLMVASGMNSDVTPGEEPRLIPSADGAWLLFTAPVRGSYELWRVALPRGRAATESDRPPAVERLTEGRHYISGWDAVPARRDGRPSAAMRVAVIRSSATELPEVFTFEAAARTSVGRELGRVTELNVEAERSVDLVEPEERWWTVDGHDVQGWHLPARGVNGPAPMVVEIHGGPHTLYGWTPVLEFQVLAAAGIGVFYANPRGSEGYGQDFNAANFADWGDGPMRDVMTGVDALVAEGKADPERLGVTGGSYGGYLTSWIVGHTERFRAAITCRSVNDLTSQMTTGDIAGPAFGTLELGAAPWEDPDLYRRLSPITYAANIRTPLLIQHSENDVRTPIGQAEQLFTVLRSLRRPVRLMRVPEETHELTRSGTPFRRAENLVQVRAWFRHFLVEGRRGLPPVPRIHGGR
jgi:acylaminoacyl-peptidase